jgi:hypothetical protein
MNEKQPEISIYSKVNINKVLMDVRIGRWGQKFGTVKDICRQYGIRYISHGDYNEFIAPKTRIQLFMEKLHFSKTSYSKKL